MMKSFLFVPMEVSQAPFYGYSVVAALCTLSYEFAFYLIFMVALTLTHRFRTLFSSIAIISIILFFLLYHNAPSIWDAQLAAVPQSNYWIIPGQLVGIITNPILFEFVIGMIVAEFYIKSGKYSSFFARSEFFSLKVLLISAILYCLISDTPGNHGLTGKGIGALFLFLVIILQQAATTTNSKSKTDLLFYFGTISYSLYLIHNSISVPILQKIPRLGDYFNNNPGIPALIACLAVSTVLSVISYRYIEKPLALIGSYIIRWRNAPKTSN